MENKKIVPYNEYVRDLGAAVPAVAQQTKKRRKGTFGYMLKVSVCVILAILLLCVGLWVLFPSVVKTPLPFDLVPTATTGQKLETVSLEDECQVRMSVEMNGVILKEGQTYSVEAGDEIKISAFSTEAEIQRIGYYSNVNMDIRDTFDNDAIILLPEFEKGTKIQLFIEAVATNDDGTANTVTKTGWKKFILEY